MKTLIKLAFLMLPLSAVAQSTPGSLKIIELYTSHGCSSCPPADQLLGELLLEHDDLVALEFHVDYWNSLIHGSDGNFVDPFSDAAYSERQRDYNSAGLSGRPGVYTPQAVVNGRLAAVGSNRRYIEAALADDVKQHLSIQINAAEQRGNLLVSVSGSDEQLNALDGVDIWLANYIDAASTDVTGGENRHRSLKNHHIVTNLQRLGAVKTGGTMDYKIEKPAEDHGCVVMIQKMVQSPVYAAVECP